MGKICAENERLKYIYASYLRDAKGREQATIDSALRALSRFEASTNVRPFGTFRIEQARKFRADLLEAVGPKGEPLSAATITATLNQVREFLLWLWREPGYRSKINPNDVAHFTPSERDRRIATARRESWVPGVEDIKRVVAGMSSETATEKRDRALIAFSLVSGARDGALRTFRLKHIDVGARSVFHDAREVATKGGKTFTSFFFPVGDELVRIVEDYFAFLRDELFFGLDDPLFPKTKMAQGADRGFRADGLAREPWASTEPIRRIFRPAFRSAGLPYVNPHAFRKTLARLGEQLCQTPEQWKAWSQNLGHESESTTFVGYGVVPLPRQATLISAVARQAVDEPFDLASELDSLLQKARGAAAT